MNIRHKFGLLAFLYVVTLVANFGVCSWCLLLYYSSFLEEQAAQSTMALSAPRPQAGWTEASLLHAGRERYILALLAFNACFGLGVAFVGARLVRQWVIRPLARLHEATDEIARGNFLHRIRNPARDELGALGAEMNKMVASIVSMQGQMVEQERRQVAAQVLRCVVHNIRSPLTGIRWLAEALGMGYAPDTPSARARRRIIEVVDGMLSWLEGFRESLASMSLTVKQVMVAAVLEQAVSSTQERAGERDVSIETMIADDVSTVRVEPAQFTSALRALMASAVCAAPRRGRVLVRAGRSNELPGYWQILLECPENTAGGMIGESGTINADDLAMADRVVRLHGGRLHWVEGLGQRCRCILSMPG